MAPVAGFGFALYQDGCKERYTGLVPCVCTQSAPHQFKNWRHLAIPAAGFVVAVLPLQHHRPRSKVFTRIHGLVASCRGDIANISRRANSFTQGGSSSMDGSVSSVAWPENHELPPFCGAVCSTNAEILVIGVAHRDEGVSGRAARKLIEKFEPDFCLVELDRQRFSRLVAARRNLPWVYAPVRGAQFRPAPIVATLRETVFSVLGFASRIVGLEDEGGGDEFFAAFEAAEQHGAFVIPGDVAVSQAIDSLVTSIRRGLADPVGHIISGAQCMAFLGCEKMCYC